VEIPEISPGPGPLPEPPRRILVLCTRRLGDVLLTTPLLRSLRRAWPQAQLDVLTLRWSAPALEGNPDLQRVIAIGESAGAWETLRALGGPRSYDLALSTLYNDRPHVLAFWAAAQRASLLPGKASRWKRALAPRHALSRSRLHTVIQYLRLADCLTIPRQYDVVPPRAAQPHAAAAALRGPYAVIHPAPMYRYKRWHVAGWQAVGRWVAAQGLRVVLTGGPGAHERRYVAEVAGGMPAGTLDLAGQPSFAQMTAVLEGAAAYVGPDTSVTHLAAATGVPTVTPFGPTGTAAWGPWPQGLDDPGDSPWRASAPLQQRGNVWLVQGVEHCVPCQREGCERQPESRADCLDRLPAARVIAALDQALRRGRAAAP
jgi:heptosyltransferase III